MKNSSKAAKVFTTSRKRIKKKRRKEKEEKDSEDAGGGEKKKTRKKGKKAKAEARPMPRMRARYRDEVIPKLMKEFGIENPNAVPRIDKVCLNMGVGETTSDRKTLDHAMEDLQKITGQKPVMTRARKSVASFKIRDGFPIGCKVTLRRQRMYEFLDRLVNVAIPRIRDFRGLNRKSFDGRGNFSMGVKEQIMFPEIDFDKIDAIRGMDITITTTAKSDDEARALLKAFNFPFRDK